MLQVRRRTVTFGLVAAVVMPHRPAWAESTKLTLILTNDIYQMGETLMADGRRRGGFARLAAVVKAERAKGGHVLFAHGGDTMSPSLMSGVDQGAHIVTLTNALKPDIFVPGNHEF
ncbi:MAG: 5-nucleotidase / UDP-sugar diphosphatase, partial [Alphaproteobacteria bacterium]|nr:5-nucleotidase / UDP-sugar diphosphatase [Alphaproteobacteria bacterium]